MRLLVLCFFTIATLFGPWFVQASALVRGSTVEEEEIPMDASSLRHDGASGAPPDPPTDAAETADAEDGETSEHHERGDLSDLDSSEHDELFALPSAGAPAPLCELGHPHPRARVAVPPRRRVEPFTPPPRA